MRGISKYGKTAVLAFMAASLCGCDFFTDVDTRIERAVEQQQTGNHPAAVIELKKALQEAPDNAVARLKLGESYLWFGQVADAENELERALRLGAAPKDVWPLLGKTMLAQRRYQTLLEQLPTELAAHPEMQILTARALLGLNRFNDARSRVSALLDNSEYATLAHLVLAETELSTGNQQQAQIILEQALAEQPTAVEVLLFAGQAGLMRGDYAKAEDYLQQSLQHGERLMPRTQLFLAMSALAEVQIRQVKKTEAAGSVAKLQKLFPGHPRTQYLTAVIAYDRGEHEKARESLQSALQAAPEFLPGLVLMGAVSYQLGNLEQADLYLNRALQVDPTNKEIRKLLAASHLRGEQPDEALAALQPALQPDQDDSELLAMAAKAKLQSGDLEAGMALLEQSAGKQPKNAALQMDLAAAYISGGQLDRAVEALQNVVATESDANRRHALMVSAYLQKQDKPAAHRYLQDLLVKQPDDIMLHLLAAAVYASGDTPQVNEAQAHFKKVLELQAGHGGALSGLGRLALWQQDYAAAQAYFKKVLDAHPKHLNSLYTLARIAMLQKQPPEARQWLQQAVNVAPDQVKPKLLLLNYLQNQNDWPSLQRQAEQFLEANGEDPAIRSAWVTALIRQQRADEAATKLKRLQPGSEHAAALAYELGRVYRAQEDQAAARQAYSEALQRQPGHRLALSALIGLEAAAGETEQVHRLLQDFKRLHPQDAVPYVLEGDWQMRREQPTAAVQAYRQAYKYAPEAYVVGKWFAAALQAEPQQAEGILQQHLQQYPKDIDTLLLLAQHYQNQARNAEAERAYERMIAVQPKHFVALNNLAWLYHLRKAAEALPTAEAAYQLEPDNPSVQDTLGWILVQQDELERGMKLLQSAAAAAPQQPDIQYHIAYGLYRQGELGKARDILQKLQAVESAFSHAKDAQALYRKLTAKP